MFDLIHWEASVFSRKGYRTFLALFWVLGLFLGVFLDYPNDYFYSSLMHSTLRCPVSIVRTVWVTGIPFILSVIAGYLSWRWLILLIVFLETFLHSYISIGIIFSAADLGWLVRGLLLFRASCVLPVLYLMDLHILNENKKQSLNFLFFCFSLVLLICSIDHCFIVPLIIQIFI